MGSRTRRMWVRVCAVALGVVVLVVVASPPAASDEVPSAFVPNRTPPAPGERAAVASAVTDVSFDGRFVLWAANPSFQTLNQTILTDQLTGTSEVLATGTRRGWSLSSDGRFVLLVQSAPFNLGVHDQQIHRLDRSTGLTTQIADNGDLGVHSFLSPKTDDAGTYVTFLTVDGMELVRLRVSNGTLHRRSAPVGRTFQRFDSSADGRFAVYMSRGGGRDVAGIYDFATGSDVPFFDVASSSGSAGAVSMSANGRYVTADGVFYDRVTGISTPFVSTTTGTTSISDDGQIVAFSTADPLVSNDTNGKSDVYIWHRGDSDHRRVSRSDRGTELNGDSTTSRLSGDGSKIVFGTIALNATVSWFTDGLGGAVLLTVDTPSAPSPSNGLVDAAMRPGGGIWHVYASGEVTSATAPTFNGCNLGQAESFSSRPWLAPDESVTSIAPTLTGNGYWLFTSRGRVITCGDAQHFGDVSHLTLDGPVIDSEVTPTGLWLLHGRRGRRAIRLRRCRLPRFSSGSTPRYHARWPSCCDHRNGVQRWLPNGRRGRRNVQFRGRSILRISSRSASRRTARGAVVAMVASSSGYLIVGSDGGIFNFGESVFHGSLGGQTIPRPIQTVLVLTDLSGYVMVDADARTYPFGQGVTILP